MKQKFFNSKIRTGVVVVLAMFLYACQNDQANFFYETENDRGAIEFAMEWFAANSPDNIGFRSSDGEVKVFMRPDWATAFKTKNDTYAVVEANVIMQDADRRKEKTQCNVRFVLRTDLETNETAGFFMTLLPNVVEEINFEQITYLDRGKHFTGTILFRGMDGNLSHGWVYEEGVISHEVFPSNVDFGGAHFRSSPVCTFVSYYFIRCPETFWITWNSLDTRENHLRNGTPAANLVYSHSVMICGHPSGGGGESLSGIPGEARMVRNVSSSTIPYVNPNPFDNFDFEALRHLDRIFNLLAYLDQVVRGGNLTAVCFQRQYLAIGGEPPRIVSRLGRAYQWMDMRLFEYLVHWAFATRPSGFYTTIPTGTNPFLRYERAIADHTAIVHFNPYFPEAEAIIGFRQNRDLITIDGRGTLRTAMPGGGGVRVGGRYIYVRLAP